MNRRRMARISAASVVIGVGLSVATASAASADFVILYYNSNGGGSCYVQSTNISDYGTRTFRQSGSACVDQAGKGQRVKNNTASVTGDLTFCMYENSGYKGRMQRIPPTNGFVNLNSSLKNNNASGRFC